MMEVKADALEQSFDAIEQAGEGVAALKQELGAVRFVRKPLLKCEERVTNGHRRRSCSVGGSESSETWDNGISLRVLAAGLFSSR